MPSAKEIFDELERRLSPELSAQLGDLPVRLRQALLTDEEMVLRMSRLAEYGASSANAIHELRQPLSGIKAFLQLMRESQDPTQEERVRQALQQVERMEAVMMRHRKFLENDEREKSLVDLSEVAGTALSLLSHHLARSKARVTTRFEPLLPRVMAHRSQLIHAVSNLLANAADAVDAAGGGQVLLTTASDERELSVTVSDWGTGIAPEVERKLFTPFFTTKGSERGTGLGLVICQRIAQNHGGKVERVHPSGHNPPKTTFRIAIPLDRKPVVVSAPVVPAAKVTPTPTTPPPAPPRAPAPQASGDRRKSILIVDDEEVIRQVLRQLLVRDGHELVEATSAEEAMRLITTREFDLVVTDKNLPGMDGVRLLELARKLRPEMKAILITGYPSETSAEAGLRLGVMDYLTKPFDEVQVVRSKINAVLATTRRTAPVVPRLPPVRPGRILVVETQTETAARLVDMLKGLKANAVLAANLEQATKFAGDGYAGAIASWEAVRPDDMLRLRELVADRPFVLVTDHVSWDKMLTAIRLGAKACLPKGALTLEMLAKELASALPQ